MSKLTAKELSYITDLLGMEAEACKKARLYSKTLTDQALSKEAARLADAHMRRFESLLTLLN